MEDSITRFAQWHRLTAAAALVQIIRDEEASATAGAQAAQQILAYSDGRPGTTKQVTPADVAAMTDEERSEFLRLLLVYYETEMPGQFNAIMLEAMAEHAGQVTQQQDLPKQNRYRRGTPEPDPPWRMPPVLAQPAPILAQTEVNGFQAAPAQHSASLRTPLIAKRDPPAIAHTPDLFHPLAGTRRRFLITGLASY
jgi:hypothetical protein